MQIQLLFRNNCVPMRAFARQHRETAILRRMNPPLILASSSPYRAELLRRLGLPFTVARPDVDETAVPGETPRDTTLRLAALKARTIAHLYPQALVIGSDQLASLAGTALGKPHTLDAARAQLARLSGQEIVFHTAVCVINPADGAAHLREVPCQVGYRTLDAARIDRYLAREPALDCAGATKIEGLGIAMARYVRCDDPTALIGLPLITVVDLLAACGVEVP